jgi:hypothetical protein
MCINSLQYHVLACDSGILPCLGWCNATWIGCFFRTKRMKRTRNGKPCLSAGPSRDVGALGRLLNWRRFKLIFFKLSLLAPYFRLLHWHPSVPCSLFARLARPLVLPCLSVAILSLQNKLMNSHEILCEKYTYLLVSAFYFHPYQCNSPEVQPGPSVA